MLINQKIAIHNLRLLLQAPNLVGISIDADNQRLTYGSISSDQQRRLLEIINNTFAFAEDREALGLPPLWILVSSSGCTLHYHSPGSILSLLSPQLEQRKLVVSTEAHAVVTIKCRDAIIEADLEVLKQASLFFENLFKHPFKERETLTVLLDWPPDALQLIVNFLHGEDLPAVDENITDLLAIAAFLCSDRLDHALSQLLTETDTLDDESWRILFKTHPAIFYPILVERHEELLSILLTQSTEPSQNTAHNRQDFTASPLIELLQKLVHHQVVSVYQLVYRASSLINIDQQLNPDAQMFFVNLINNQVFPFFLFHGYINHVYNDRIERINLLFSPDFFAKILVLNLQISSLTHDQIIALILKCPNLTTLILPKTVSGPFLTCLQHTPKLRHLDISECNLLDPNWLENMKFVPHLRRISYKGSFSLKITPAMYPQIREFAPTIIRKILQILLTQPTDASDSHLDPKQEETEFENLLLSLINDERISMDRLLRRVGKIVSSSVRLNLHAQRFFVTLINRDQLSFPSLCSALGGVEELRFLFSHAMFRKIEKLHLKRSNFNNRQVIFLLEHCPNLVELSLPNTVSDELLCCLRYTQRLRYLDISGCDRLKADSLQWLCHTPNLTRLNISCCDQFTAKDLRHVGKYAKPLVILTI